VARRRQVLCATRVDQQYMDATQDAAAVIRRKVPLDRDEILRVADATMEVGSALFRLLPLP
jgi:hypothetical protein